MRKPYVLFFVILIYYPLNSQNFTISGYVEDSESGERLIAANIWDENSHKGTVSNDFGFFSITLPTDTVKLTISYIGYLSARYVLYLNQDEELNAYLQPSLALETVEVTAERTEKIEDKSQMSQIAIPVEQIKMAPALLGEVDVLKTIQLLPGVQSGGEGQSGLYVRGGSPDQNLILLDGVPVYNVSHVLGIFSVFNADAIKNVTLTKGGFPARFGGRLSSVLEINMKDGNNKEWHGEGSIGIISSKLTLEGPLKKEKTSFLISGRRTYADLIAKPFVGLANRKAETKVTPRLFFYDLNTKISHTFNQKHRLFGSAYLGSDVFRFKSKNDRSSFNGGLDWGNIISALRWNMKISNKLFSNVTATYSKYNLDVSAAVSEIINNTENSFSSVYLSGIEDLGLKWSLDWVLSPQHYLKMGVQSTRHRYTPGALTIKAKSEDEEFNGKLGTADITSLESAAYIEDDINLGRLRLNIGAHASLFRVNHKNYSSFQPRLSLRYLLANKWSLKGSFSTMTQYINLLTSEALSLPTDLWVPSTDKVQPQQSWQVAGGIAKTLWDKYELSIEGYYKHMDRVLSFKPGATFLFGLENDWQDKITQGDGQSYGTELFLQKKSGKTTGWLGYTLSWNWRRFDLINGGERFPYRYDRRHDLSIVVNHEFNDRISLSGAWIYGTGNAVTIPINAYDKINHNYNLKGEVVNISGTEIQNLGTKNGFRMSDYHRLDLSISFKKQKKWGIRSWVFGVYNAYWHRNPYFILSDQTVEYNHQTKEITSKQSFKEISILPIIPSFSYQFKF